MRITVCNVARFLGEMAQQNPEHCAVRVPISRKGKTTLGTAIAYHEKNFSQLAADSDAVVHLLKSDGVCPQMRVLLMVKPGLELILITFALFKLGAVPIVIDPGMGLKHFLKCVERSQPQALIGIPLAHGLSWLFYKKFSSVSIRIKVAGHAFYEAFEKHVGRSFEITPTQSDDLAAILFTSGSTGPPKGVCYEHGMFEAQVRLIRERYAIEPGEVDLPMLPIFALFNPAMGMTTVVPEMNPSRPATVEPVKIVQAIQQNRVTNSFGSPVLWTKIGRYCTDNSIQLPSLKRILIAGAPVSPALIKQFEAIIPHGEIHTPYGATESLPVTSISGKQIVNQTWKQTAQGKGTCVGQPFEGMTVKIIAPNDSAITSWQPELELKTGAIGEIVVQGPVVTKAYDRLEEVTQKSKIADEAGTVWHRIGDLGYIDEAGFLWFCGRKAERVQAKNGLFYTDLCEAIINQHPDVYRSALIGLGEPGNQTPALVIEREKGSALSPKELLQKVAAHAKQFEITASIDHFFIHGPFPVDIRHNAKIHRLTLKAYYDKKMRPKLSTA